MVRLHVPSAEKIVWTREQTASMHLNRVSLSTLRSSKMNLNLPSRCQAGSIAESVAAEELWPSRAFADLSTTLPFGIPRALSAAVGSQDRYSDICFAAQLQTRRFEHGTRVLIARLRVKVYLPVESLQRSALYDKGRYTDHCPSPKRQLLTTLLLMSPFVASNISRKLVSFHSSVTVLDSSDVGGAIVGLQGINGRVSVRFDLVTSGQATSP